MVKLNTGTQKTQTELQSTAGSPGLGSSCSGPVSDTAALWRPLTPRGWFQAGLTQALRSQVHSGLSECRHWHGGESEMVSLSWQDSPGCWGQAATGPAGQANLRPGEMRAQRVESRQRPDCGGRRWALIN